MPMTKTVEIGGATVEVTPMDELGPSWSMTAAVIAGRIELAQDDGDMAAVKEAVGDLVEICTEDGITSDGVQDLDPPTLNALIRAMLPDEAFEPGGDADG